MRRPVILFSLPCSRILAIAVAMGLVCSGALMAAKPGGKTAKKNRPVQVNNKKGSDAFTVASQVDKLLTEEFARQEVPLSALVNDEQFLRRVSLDLAGRVPDASEVTLFGLDPNPNKRVEKIDQLLQSTDYAKNWARYWRDVIYMRATEMRAQATRPVFEEWMTEHLQENTPWGEITTELLTATGDVRENGATALFMAQAGDPAEVAAETSRIFLGIQMQCANCHDHPTDKWKREQFHQLAAFFPRVQVRRVNGDGPRSFEIASVDRTNSGGRYRFLQNPEQLMRRMDANNDKKISKSEVKGERFERIFERMLSVGDKNGDKALSAKEIKQIPPPGNNRRATSEYYMPDLSDPGSQGKKVKPLFFVNKSTVPLGSTDMERRQSISQFITSSPSDNPWFARAYVNRIWSEMFGQGFYMPVDDMGPGRSVIYPDVLELLCKEFVAHNHDIKWLFRTIANTDAYQRAVSSTADEAESVPFSAMNVSRLSGDQLYSSLANVLGFEDQSKKVGDAMTPRARARSPRNQFNALFAFDPSTSQDELIGTVPQALFMMNSPQLNRLIRARGLTRLSQLLSKYDDDNDALAELYILVLSREPNKNELRICREYLKQVGDRSEAYEDLMWSLLNSTEFLSNR